MVKDYNLTFTTIDYINKLTAMVDFVKELANSNSVGNDFVINGTKHSNMSYDDMKAIIDAELAK